MMTRTPNWRNYYGLPVTLRSDPDGGFVRGEANAGGSRGEHDVGRYGLHVRFVDSDPYWAAIIFQHGEPIAHVDCISNQNGLIRGLAEDSDEKLREVFGIVPA